MKTWTTEIELVTRDKIIATRTDKVPELIQAIRKWRLGIRSEVTTRVLSHQNGPTDQNIRIAVLNIRAIPKEAELPLES
jgi:hypothetical protein